MSLIDWNRIATKPVVGGLEGVEKECEVVGKECVGTGPVLLSVCRDELDLLWNFDLDNMLNLPTIPDRRLQLHLAWVRHVENGSLVHGFQVLRQTELGQVSSLSKTETYVNIRVFHK